jgi:predicted O-methyltransferase YrrM
MDIGPFTGTQYYLADNWFNMVPLEAHAQRPIRYLEIGAFYGANLLSVEKTYAAHPESRIYCVDPWKDYDEYPEYKTMQASIFEKFLSNVSRIGEKLVIRRGFSNREVPLFEDDFFDIIYIDGNHEPEYVLEDAVLAFRKLKPNGILIFDDYGWGGPDLTQRGIDAFLSGYHKRIRYLGMQINQVFVQKKESGV